MKRWITCIAIAAVVAAATSRGWCASETIAVMDLERTLKAFYKTGPAADELRDEVESRKVKLTEMEQKVRAAQEEAGNPALSEKARDGKMKVVRSSVKEYRAYERDLISYVETVKRDLLEQRMRMRKRFVKEVRGVVTKYAEKKKLNIVLDAAGGVSEWKSGVIFSKDGMDITDDIIKILNKDMPRSRD